MSRRSRSKPIRVLCTICVTVAYVEMKGEGVLAALPFFLEEVISSKTSKQYAYLQLPSNLDDIAVVCLE
jgi:hypothetical protein